MAKPENYSATRKAKASTLVPFFTALLMLAFSVGVFAGVYGTFTKSPIVGLGLRTWFAVDGYLKTGVIAPPLLLTPTPDNAPADRIVVATDAKKLSGWRVIAAYDHEKRGYLVRLIDASGEIVHVWPIADPALSPDGFSKSLVTPHGVAVLPNGDIVVNSDRMQFIAGYDRCGREKWRRDEPFHHQLSVDEEGGIWSWLGEKSAYSQQQWMVRLDPATGETLEKISLVDDVLAAKPGTAELFGLSPSYLQGHIPDADPAADLFHPNDVEALPAALEGSFPLFRKGDLLVSFRNIDMVAVIDRTTHEIKWSQRGPWSRQHDPEFMPTGEISVFNNNYDGLNDNTRYDRRSYIVIVNPANRELTFRLNDGSPRLYSAEMGAHAWGANGVLQIASPHEGRVLEVDAADDRVLFEFNNRLTKGYSGNVATADWLPADYFDEDPNAYSCDN